MMGRNTHGLKTCGRMEMYGGMNIQALFMRLRRIGLSLDATITRTLLLPGCIHASSRNGVRLHDESKRRDGVAWEVAPLRLNETSQQQETMI